MGREIDTGRVAEEAKESVWRYQKVDVRRGGIKVVLYCRGDAAAMSAI